MVSKVSVKVPIWLSLIRIALAQPRSIPRPSGLLGKHQAEKV
jgi:hypothetical protein